MAEVPSKTYWSQAEYYGRRLILDPNIRGLRSRARFKRDETRQDWKAIPELAGPGQDYFFMVPLLGKIRKKIRDGTGLLGTTREKSWMVLK